MTAFNPLLHKALFSPSTTWEDGELVFWPDIVVRSLQNRGFLDIHFQLATPGSTAGDIVKAWYKPDAGNAAPGDFYHWDAGANSWEIGYVAPSSGGSGGLSDGDYGDVTVSGGGTVITVDDTVITPVKMNDLSGLSAAQIASLVAALSGEIDDSDVTAASSATNYTPAAATVEGHLAGLDTALGSVGGGSIGLGGDVGDTIYVRAGVGTNFLPIALPNTASGAELLGVLGSVSCNPGFSTGTVYTGTWELQWLLSFGTNDITELGDVGTNDHVKHTGYVGGYYKRIA